MKKINSKKGVVFIYILFFVELFAIYKNSDVCSFEHSITKLHGYNFDTVTGEYEFEIEQKDVYEEDIYRLVNISGWLIKKDRENYIHTDADLLLISDTGAYKLKIYFNKRTDLVYLDQSDINSKNLYVGWFGRFPIKSIENGMYKIGFIIKENGKRKILMTDEYIYILKNKPIDLDVGFTDSKLSQDYMYTEGMFTADNGYFEEDGSFVIEGKNDFAFWGPYVSAPVGKYNFTLNYEVIENSEREVVGEFDIALGSVRFKSAQIKSDSNSVTIKDLELSEIEAGKLLEYRAYIYDGVSIRLKSIDIERVD